MSVMVRLRIELADAPGSLAQVAAIIGEHGGNITAIDVQEGSPSSAIDEVTVEFQEDANLQKLRHHLSDSGAARVVSHQTANRIDPVLRMLQRLADILPASPHERDEGLRRGVAELCSTPVVWVASPDDAVAYSAGRQALERAGEAALICSDEPLPALAGTISGKAWLLAVADRLAGSRHRVVLVARPETQEFTTTEISRVEALVALHEQIEQLRP
ncbi:MAG TPA: ACT domain-containing protein [Acidimicrobiales bacterium]|nr:ACT domain-containing protein [Acidimicrobiales bacterium]